MAAGRIKGITIEIGANTTALTKALAGIDNALKNTQSNLRDINKALKFDPSNTALLKDKQVELAYEVEKTKEKLEKEKQALEQMKNTEGFDANSQAARNLQTQIDLDTAALKELEAQAKQASSVLGTQMQVAGERIQEVGTKIKAVGDSISGLGRKITTAVTVPIVAAGTKAVQTFAEVDKTMTLTNATMGNTADEAKNLEDAMKSAASNSTFSMNDAATATLNFARAGLDASEAASALAPAMNLAAGEGGDLETVSAGLVATINGFGDSFDKASTYADVFANACNNSALDVNSLSSAFSVAAPVFKTAGYNVQDAALYMGTMANAGIEANEAATALKTGLARLVSPAKQGAEMMEQLGINITNADGSMKDTVTVQKELHDAFAQLSESEQIAAASAIFGKNQMSNWLALINTAPSEIQALNDALDDQGTTAKMAEEMMSGFGGSLEKLKSSINVAAYALGKAFAPTVSKVADKIQELVDWFNSLDEAEQQAIAKQAMIAAAIGPVLVVIGTLTSSIGSIVTVVGKVVSGIGTLMSSAGSLSGVLTALTGPVGIVIGVVAALAAGFAYLFTTNEQFRNSIMQVVQLIQTNFSAALAAIQPKLQTLIDAFNNLMVVLAPIFEALFKTIMGIINGIITAIYPIIDVITEVVNLISALITGFLALLQGDFTTFYASVQSALQAFLNIITGIFQAICAFWQGFFQAFGVNLKSIFTTIWNGIKTVVTTKIEQIKTVIDTKWTAIKEWLFETLQNIWDKFKEIFENIKQSVSEKITEVKNTIVNGMEEACDYIRELPGKFFNWGKDMVENLISGIQSKIDALRRKISELAGLIGSYIHFSEPDVGPLSNFHTFMPDMIDEMVRGINNGIPRVESAMSGLTGSMAQQMQGPSNNQTVATNNVSINVYGAQGQNVQELATEIEQIIANNVVRRGVAFG